MPLHRLVTPTYIGGLPGTHDLINDGTPDDAAADGPKVGGQNSGTLFVAFGEDATSSNANRPHKALAQSTDFLDDVVSGALPVPTELDVTAPGGAVASKQLTDLVFVSDSYANNQANRDRLIELTDDSGREIVDPATGQKVLVTEIRKSDNVTNAVGNETTGFTTNPYVHFSPSIPAGVNYRLTYSKKGTLVDAIPNLTYADILTRLGIPSAHQVPAEVELFMRQASLRSGSPYSLTTIKSNAFATADGTYGTSKSDEMRVDVDLSNDAGAAFRSWLLFFGNASALNIQEHNTKGADYIEITTPRSDLGLEDGRLIANHGPMALSAVDHGYLRWFDEDSGESGSLMKVLNNRVIMTCGDGTTTFGDFEGSTAVHDAVSFWITNNAAESAIIYVKAGIYTFSTKLTLPAGRRLTIIGVSSRDDAAGADAVEFVNSTAGDEVFTLSSSTGSELHIENVSFTRDTGDEAVLVNTGLCSLYMRNCRFTDQSLSIVGTSNHSQGGDMVHLQRCYFDCSGVAGNAPISFSSSASVAVRGMLFDDCYFANNTTRAAIRVIAGGTATWYLRKVLFNRCHFSLVGCSVTTGNPTTGSQTGVMSLEPDNTAGSPYVEDIEFRDCLVFSSSGNFPGLLYLRTSDGTSGSFIGLRKLVIRGGSWSAGTTQITPIYIGGETVTSVPNVDTVVFDDVSIYLPSDYGSCSVETGGVTDGEHSAIFVSTQELLKVRDLRLPAVTNSGRNGDFETYAYDGNVDIDGLSLGEWGSGWNAGSAGVPEHRVKLTKRYPAGNNSNYQIIRRVVMQPPTATSRATVGALFVACPGALIEKCFIKGFDGTSQAGIWLEPAKVNGVIVQDCEIQNCDIGIKYYPLSDPGLTLTLLRVLNNRVSSCYSHGILLVSDDGFTHNFQRVRVESNICSGNTGYGIMIGPSAWTSGADDEDDIEVLNNTCTQNNGSSTFNGQIAIGWDGVVSGSGARGIVMGNNCGTEYIDVWGVLPGSGLRGLATSVDVSSSPANVTDFAPANGQQCIFNNAGFRLKTVI